MKENEGVLLMIVAVVREDGPELLESHAIHDALPHDVQEGHPPADPVRTSELQSGQPLHNLSQLDLRATGERAPAGPRHYCTPRRILALALQVRPLGRELLRLSLGLL